MAAIEQMETMKKNIESRLLEDVSMCFFPKPHVLMGDDDFFELLDENKDRFKFSRSDGYLETNHLMFYGAKIVSNATPGTRGWIIGSAEQIEQMRAAIWASRYYLLFKDVGQGFSLVRKEKP